MLFGNYPDLNARAILVEGALCVYFWCWCFDFNK